MGATEQLIADVLTELAKTNPPERENSKVLTLFPDYAVLSATGIQEVNVHSQDHFYSCMSPGANLTIAQNFTKHSGGDLQFVGEDQLRNILMVASVSGYLETGDQLLEFRFRHGTSFDVPDSHQKLHTPSSVPRQPRYFNTNLVGMWPLCKKNEILGIDVANLTSSANVFIEKLTMAAVALPNLVKNDPS